MTTAAQQERAFAVEVVSRLRDAGFEALWAGGCVRDELLGRTPHDYDVATDAEPEEVRGLFRRTVAVGESFKVIDVLGPRVDGVPLKVQVATYRSDGTYTDGRHPDSVTSASAREDALRRDFTINGMFFDPLGRRVIDFVGGQADLAAKVLRAIGDPRQRFTEDKLRLLRAVRFATRFELTLDPATADAVREMADRITVVAAERIAEELRKLLTDPHRAAGVRLLDSVNLVGPILPELLPLKESGDRWGHTVGVLERLPDPVSFPLGLAALLHATGPRAAGAVCLRLKLSNTERERVEWLVEHRASLRDAPAMRRSKLFPILAHAGVAELLALHRADAEAAGRGCEHVAFCERVLREMADRINPPPLITGDDLRAHGLTPGPLFKRLLDAVRAAQLDEEISTPAEALALADRLAAKEIKD
jgi:poly(A) polymerase